MRQTLFAIPDEIFGVPIFGLGLLLGVWIVVSAISAIRQFTKSGWNADLMTSIIVSGIIGVLIIGVSPRVLIDLEDGGRGLPIRGYGVMLLLAIVSGVGLSIYRGRKVGLQPDTVINLAFCMIVAGLAGARLFWIIQYWELLQADTVSGTLSNMFNFVEGGLVVYGSLIGGLIAAIVFFRSQKLPLLGMADLIAPSMALGLAIGRIGCLMNGCCFGGVCEQPWAIQFPDTAPAYGHQKSLGQLHGFRIKEDKDEAVIVGYVKPEEAAAKGGLKEGSLIERINGREIKEFAETNKIDRFTAARDLMEATSGEVQLSTDAGLVLIQAELPTKSLRVHPTQIYSAVNATFLCLVLVAVFPYRRRDGEVIALTLTLYPIGRFVLEQIRQDEPGKFGTNLTISQIVSLVLLGIAAALWLYLWSRPARKTAWPSWQDGTSTQAIPTVSEST